MSLKIITVIFFVVLLPFSALSWDLSGNLDVSYQYNSNFVDAGLVEEASSLVTGEAAYSKQVKLNLSTENNFSKENYTKFGYTLDLKDYNQDMGPNSTAHTFEFLVDQRLSDDTALRVDISGKKNHEQEIIKRYFLSTCLIKLSKNLASDLNLELGVSVDDKTTDNSDARDYFAYMSYAQQGISGNLRYQLSRELITSFNIKNSKKIYAHKASGYLSTVFPSLVNEYREDDNAVYNLDLLYVINENLLADLSAGYAINFSNIPYYSYTGNVMSGYVFGYWLGNRWEIKYTNGDYLYPRRSWGGYREENIKSETGSIEMRRNIMTDTYLTLKWEGLRNSSNNAADEFSNDCYTAGIFVQL